MDTTDMVAHTTDSIFSTDVEQASGLVVVDLWAEWCGPCKTLAPIFERVAQEFQGQASFFKLDVDENPKSTARYNVRSIPTLLFFRDGVVVDMVVGVVSQGKLADKVRTLL